jgi:hypothetical protein
VTLLDQIAKDEKIKDACKKIDYRNHKDLYQELFIILCELPAEKLEQMYSNGYLQYWVVRTLLNMTSPRGNFYRKYYIINDESEADKRLEEIEEDKSELFELEKKRREVEALLQKYEEKGRDGFGWYKVTLLKLYSEVGSYRKMGELTGISYRTICEDINEFIKELRTNLNITSD